MKAYISGSGIKGGFEGRTTPQPQQGQRCHQINYLQPPRIMNHQIIMPPILTIPTTLWCPPSI